MNVKKPMKTRKKQQIRSLLPEFEFYTAGVDRMSLVPRFTRNEWAMTYASSCQPFRHYCYHRFATPWFCSIDDRIDVNNDTCSTKLETYRKQNSIQGEPTTMTLAANVIFAIR
jgi:hypothetical protein